MVRPAPRLPGVYVETVRPPPADPLPRMDVAAFVGFAASGPLHLPVAVEDAARFREIFGDDLILARDEARERDQRSLMGPAVEAFFANGGRRAFVVRVADKAQAETLLFRIPGLTDSGLSAAIARARSPGLWPAGLAPDTRLVRSRLFPAPDGGLSEREPDQFTLRIAPGTKAPRPGDLIEATFVNAGLIALIVVAQVENGVLTARQTEVFWRRAVGPSPPLSSPASPPASPASPPASPASPPVSPAMPPQVGALGIDDENLVPVDMTDPSVVALLGTAPLPDRLSVLTFDLVLWDGARIAHRLDGLGFAGEHPRYWAAAPDDAALFVEIQGRAARPINPVAERFRAEVSSPRFPLAGPGRDAQPRIWLPDGMKTGFDRNRAELPTRSPVSPLEAEGLASFSDSLFLDNRLSRINAQVLAAELEALFADEQVETEPLLGLHALAPIDEVSMLAVPDAVHRGWMRPTLSAPQPLAAPRLDPLPSDLDGFGRLAVSWSAVADAERYRLEIASTEDFDDIRPVTALTEGAAIPLASDCPAPVAVRVRAERRGAFGPWSNVRLGLVPAEEFGDCEGPDFDRLSLILSADLFASPAPTLSWGFETPVSPVPSPPDRFELQSGVESTLDDAVPVALDDDSATSHVPELIPGGGRYFRVRVLRGGSPGPWSETVYVGASALGGWTLEPEAEDPQGWLTAIHRGMIRFAAGRADAVALLSLPRHFREAEVESHLARLSPLIDDSTGPDEGNTLPAGAANVSELSISEQGALSYAALQHPWMSTADGSSQDFQPPDGAMAGLMARRAREDGAWIAAANLPLSGALALDPQFDDAAVIRLIARQVNPLRRDPRGFLVFNADTLSPADELRPLPARRLMILLRRLALREGSAYVFEPNNADFRAQVRRRFERMLSLIFERGGFAGDRPEAGFQVVTDASVNPPSAVDRGRFLVELRVAPSRPFRYLNVRLLRTGPERLSVQEA